MITILTYFHTSIILATKSFVTATFVITQALEIRWKEHWELGSCRKVLQQPGQFWQYMHEHDCRKHAAFSLFHDRDPEWNPNTQVDQVWEGSFSTTKPNVLSGFRVMFEYVWLSSSVMILVVTVKELGRILLWVISFSHQAIALWYAYLWVHMQFEWFRTVWN